MYISRNSNPRDNNLNFIRLIAALAVIIAHSYPIILGKGNYDFVYNAIGLTLGEIAVDIFFIISGFLITISLVSKQNLLDYSIARVLRIYPAMIVMLIFTIIVLGLPQTTLDVFSFLFHHETLLYFYKNGIIITGGYNYLPGLFSKNPFSPAVNGSLWTILWEVRFYILLGIIFAITKKLKNIELFKPIIFTTFFSIIILSLIIYFFNENLDFPSSIKIFCRLGYFFFLGAVISFIKYKINLNWAYFLIILILLIISGLFDFQSFQIIYYLSLGYLILFLAYAPKGMIRKYNEVGD